MTLAFAAIILIMTIALISTMYGLNNNRQQIANLRHISKEANLIHNIESELITSQKIFKEFYISGETDLITSFQEHLGKMNDYILELENIDVDVAHTNLILQIKNSVAEYNDEFSIFYRLDNERLTYYQLASDNGQVIIDSLEFLQSQSRITNDTVGQIITSSASSYLLQARLHAMKYFTFHELNEFNNYQMSFSKFKEQLEGWQDISVDHAELYAAIENYESFMLILKDIIESSDEQVALMDKTEQEIVREVESLNNIIESDEIAIENEVASQSNFLVTIGVVMTVLSLILTVIISRWLISIVLDPIESLRKTFVDISKGEVNVDFRLNDQRDDEIGMMSKAFNQFMVNLKEMIDNIYQQDWIKTALNELNPVTRSTDDLEQLSQEIIKFICYYIEAPSAALYIKDEQSLNVYGTFGVQEKPKNFEVSHGLVGQCYQDDKMLHLKDVDETFLNIETGLLEQKPNEILIVPCSFNNQVIAVLEIATRFNFSETEMALIESLAEPIAIAIHSTIVQNQLKALLEKTLHQSEELQVQQEELRQSNEELEEQTRALKESESILQHQREELRVSNEELEERALQLEQQKKALDETNHEILVKQHEILDKAEALEKANAYKSEFLANMSHELRTPLNSILVLSQLLSEKEDEKPLTTKEQEFAQTIYSSGTDLLRLINDILDLSKVEAGHLDVHLENFDLQNIIDESNKLFKPITDKKSIEFIGILDEDLDSTMVSDYLRIQQILKNLISNAIKFTSKGHVKLHIRKVTPFEADTYNFMDKDCIAFEVSDTGIGIDDEKQKLIFEAFKQSDGTTSRKYGGTGLGLTISRELSELLGGCIYVESQKAQGSQFTLLLPTNHIEKKVAIDFPEQKVSENLLVIIEDDENFAHILETLAEEKGFDVMTVHSGRDGLEIIKSHRPSAVLLDLGLPDMDGLEIASILEDLSIPVHIISGNDANHTLPNNVIGYLKKPVDIKAIYQTLAKIEAMSKKPDNYLLIIGDCNGENFEQFTSLGHLQTDKIADYELALKEVHNEKYDCIIVDYDFQTSNGARFIIDHIDDLSDKPIIIYSENQLDTDALKALNHHADNIILRSDRSDDRLIDEVSLFLHGMRHVINEHLDSSEIYKNKILDNISQKIKDDNTFEGKKVLIVDDDDRNVFALTHALAHRGFDVHVAGDGFESIEKVKETSFDLILMDIMMPKMDGYEAIKEIRGMDVGKDVPIIALTAKAMKDDRIQCIEAGANDYMTKPIDMDKLISTMKVWLA